MFNPPSFLYNHYITPRNPAGRPASDIYHCGRLPFFGDEAFTKHNSLPHVPGWYMISAARKERSAMHFRLNKDHTSTFNALYSQARLPDDIRRSLFAMMLGNMFGTLWGTITGGSALTRYAAALGANDLVYGMLTAIPLAAGLIQIPAAVLVSRTRKRKQYMLTYGVFSRALWLVIGLVPFFLPADPSWLRMWSVIFLIGLSAASGSFINVCFTPWMADLVPIAIRGRWLSGRDRIISVIAMGVGLFTAYLLDRIPGYPGYAVVLCLGGALGITDMICFLFVKDKSSVPPVKVELIKVAKQIFKDKPFFRFMLFWTLWCLTANIGNAYIPRYILGELRMSNVQFTVSGMIAASLTTAVSISFWGRMIDRFGCKPVIWLTGIFTAIAPLSYLVAVPGSLLPMLLHNIVGAAFWSGTNLAATSMQLSASPDDQRPSYIAFFSSFTSLFGSFLGVLVGGLMLEALRTGQEAGWFLMDRYKAVIGFSALSRLAVGLLFVPLLKNENSYEIKDLLHYLRRRRPA
jgi:MFS family permease